MKLLSAFAALVVILLLAACDNGTTPTAVTTSPTQDASGQPTAATGDATATRGVTGRVTTTGKKAPALAFMPVRGGPDTMVNITGGNFEPGKSYVLRIGIPDPIGEPLASVQAGDDGRWNTSITIPGTEPSGKAITTDNMMIVVMDDEDNQVLVSKAFKFIPKQ